MTQDVSCRALDLFFRQAEREAIPLERLREGSRHSLAYLRDGRNWLSWNDYSVLCENVGRLWTPEQLANIGASYLSTGAMRHVGVVARLLFTPLDFYRLVLVRQSGEGNQVFRCIEPESAEVGPMRIQVDLRLLPGYAPCPEFFHTSRGNFSGMPEILGYRRAEVDMTWIDRGARYVIHVPEGRAFLASLWRALSWPFTARAAARELRVAHQSLSDRYRELESTRQALARQAEALQTADMLGRELAAKTELPALYDSLVQLLTSSRFGYTAVALRVAESPGATLQLVRETTTRPPADGRTYPLEWASEQVGLLEVWGQQAPSEQDLLSALAPWVAIAISNARSVALLRQQQLGLEQEVERRTSQLQATTRALEDSLRRALEAEREKSQFFANASHELRTPLTLLVSPLETLLLRAELSGDTKRELRSSLSSAYRLLKLVNDLLDLSKLDAGAMVLRTGAMDLSRLLEEALRTWRPPLERRQVTVTISLPPQAPMVGDPERLEQVVHNLLANAAKHTPDGGRVMLDCVASEQGYNVRLSNTGEGIDPVDLPRLFDRFAQGMRTRSRRFGSTGLGLPLVKDLVELHGGTVNAASERGVTTFRFFLPKGQISDQTIPAPEILGMTQTEQRQYEQMGTPEHAEHAVAPPPAGALATEHRPLLLVVEDNAELRAFLARGLVDNFEVLVAETGTQGLELARNHSPDVILSDWMLPEMDGVELCRTLHADPATAIIPFLLLTARTDLGSKLAGLGSGADDFILKPFHLEEVRARLSTHAKLRRAVRELAHAERLASLGTLVAGVAHELRNPLNGVVNALIPSLQLLGNQSAEVSSLLQLALSAAERAVTLTSRLLEGARVDGGLRTEVDLVQNVQLAVDLLRHLGAGGPSVHATLPPEGAAVVLGEAGALSQVWIHLLENAIQAAGKTGHVWVTLQAHEGMAEVQVQDDGPGIPPELQTRIFDPFFTTKAPGEGTGLGLSLARQAVVAQGGKLSVHSESGKGATFRVLLPLLPPSDPRPR